MVNSDSSYPDSMSYEIEALNFTYREVNLLNLFLITCPLSKIEVIVLVRMKGITPLERLRLLENHMEIYCNWVLDYMELFFDYARLNKFILKNKKWVSIFDNNIRKPCIHEMKKNIAYIKSVTRDLNGY